jgi:hypothetical protein
MDRRGQPSLTGGRWLASYQFFGLAPERMQLLVVIPLRFAQGLLEAGKGSLGLYAGPVRDLLGG